MDRGFTKQIKDVLDILGTGARADRETFMTGFQRMKV